MEVHPFGRTVAVVRHHVEHIAGKPTHYVTTGEAGSTVVLVHGFPESWWAFNRLIPLLAVRHRVVAVDLPGFGDSGIAGADDTSETISEDLSELIAHLGVGPVHLLAQDISGAVAFRLAANHPSLLKSLTGVEMGLAGFGLEVMADASHGGAWYIGSLATPGVADAFFSGHEQTLIGRFILPTAMAEPSSLLSEDVSEFSRGYARPGGWNGAAALYKSMLSEGAAIQDLAKARPLTLPVLAVDRKGSSFTYQALQAVHTRIVRHAEIAGAGHYIAQEAADKLASAILPFLSETDHARG